MSTNSESYFGPLLFVQLTRNILASILARELLIPPKKRRHAHTFTREPEFLSLQFGEYLEELLHKSDKLFSKLVLVLDIWSPLREASADRLLDPENRGEISPTVFVDRGPCLAIGPRKGLSDTSDLGIGAVIETANPVLLEKSLKRRTSRTAIRPTQDLVHIR